MLENILLHITTITLVQYTWCCSLFISLLIILKYVLLKFHYTRKLLIIVVHRTLMRIAMLDADKRWGDIKVYGDGTVAEHKVDKK